jgi:hypothetical protein
MEDVTDAIDDSARRNTPLEPLAKPRPSEIAAKLAKAKAKTKKLAKATPKPKTKKLAKAKPKPKAKLARKGRPLVRTCRMDIRLAPKELAKLKRIAKAKYISATAMLVRLIEKAA